MTDITEWRTRIDNILEQYFHYKITPKDREDGLYKALETLLQQVDRESRTDQTTKLIQMLLSTKTNDFNVYFDKLKAEKAALTQKGK